MSHVYIFYFALIVMVIVPIRSIQWAGAFQLLSDCNVTACCCPSSDLLIKHVSSKHEGTLNVTGFDCKKHGHHGSFSIDNATANTVSVASLGNFTMTNENELEVFLEQNATSRAACKVIMTRLITSTVVNNGSTSHSHNHTTTYSTQETTNDVVSNHGSIFLTFISIIMIPMSIIHV